ncbi:uncharacterized protein LOC127860512 [Dreissena polymorpha]|uniref:uncharacterized protein LOC127860512 n=1 Tax=Dreissena polymorpha TaxID=45954 RepID=UPI002264507D|nr:uncharacterized protein LOC127860512 [Dreissena polymorpha]
MEKTRGKIRCMLDVKDSGNRLNHLINGENWMISPKADVTLLTGEHFMSLLKTHFETYEPSDENDKLVQAVMKDDVKNVYAIIHQAYCDFYNEEIICEYGLTTAIADSQDKVYEERYLNPHHDLFVLVENSTFMKFGGEIKFRANLEKRISSEMIRSRMQDTTKHGKSIQQVNVVNLVFNGNHHTLETVTHAMNFGTVSVVVKGSKGVAEKIAYEVESTTDIQKRHDKDYEDRMKAFQATLHRQPYLLWVWDLQNMPDKPHERILDIFWKAKWIENHLASALKRDLSVVYNLLASTDCSSRNTDDLVCYFCIHDYIEPVRTLVQHLGSMDSDKIDVLQYKKMCNKADTDGLLKGLRRKFMVPPANKDLVTIMEVIQILKARPVRGTIDGNMICDA